MTLETLINSLVTKNTKIFLQALEKVGVTEFPKNKVGFEADVLQTLITSELTLRLNNYVDSKKSNFRNKGNKTPFINTPHPIGNIPGILLDFFTQASKIQLNKLLAKSDQKLEKLENRLKKLKTKIISENFAFEDELENLNEEELIELLAQKFVARGLDARVISKERQTELSKKKMQHLGAGEDDLNWVGVDADGDPSNNMTTSLGKEIAGENIVEIFESSQERSKNESAFQPRISCREGKRGVEGAVISLNKITGVNEITSLDDILNQTSFDKKYANFSDFLANTIYGEVQTDEDRINLPLDIILRATLSNFTNANSLVLSDFPSTNEEGEELLARLLFVKKATDRFLEEQLGGKFTAKPQKFLPLCENEGAINNLKGLITSILDKIAQRAETIANNEELSDKEKPTALEKLKAQFSENQQLVFGAFFGPSDLTADMGGISLAVINNAKYELAQTYETFQNRISLIGLKLENINFGFDDITLEQQYGKGSSPYRGGNLMFEGIRTNQGQALSATDTTGKKYKDEASFGELSYVEIPEHILEQSVKNHRHFLQKEGDLGIIASQYNDLLKSSMGKDLMFPTTKDYSNNQGTRGKSGVVEFQNQRAIGQATLRAYFGLLQTPSFPYDVETQEILDWGENSQEQCAFSNFVNHPAGFQVLMGELFQACVFDPQRAEILGFDEEAITKSSQYVNGVLTFLSKTFGVEMEGDISQCVQGVVDELKTSDFIQSPYLKEKLESFSKQIPIISDISAKLTEKVQSLQINIKEENLNSSENAQVEDEYENSTKIKISTQRKQICAAIGTYLNLISNFQLPAVSSHDPSIDVVRDMKNANQDRTPDQHYPDAQTLTEEERLIPKTRSSSSSATQFFGATSALLS